MLLKIDFTHLTRIRIELVLNKLMYLTPYIAMNCLINIEYQI